MTTDPRRHPRGLQGAGAHDGYVLRSVGNVAMWLPDMPSGGAAGQVLAKASSTDWDTIWATPSASAAAWIAAINDPLSTTGNLKTALSGAWAINAGVLRQSTNTSGLQALITHNTSVTPTAIRAAEVEMAYISAAGTNRRMGLMVSSTNVTSGNLVVYADSSNGTTWTIKVEQNGVTLYFTSATISYAGSGYLRLGVIQSGGSIDLYLGGTYLASCKITAFTEGQWVGLYTVGAAADFRNLKAWTVLTSPF